MASMGSYSTAAMSSCSAKSRSMSPKSLNRSRVVLPLLGRCWSWNPASGVATLPKASSSSHPSKPAAILATRARPVTTRAMRAARWTASLPELVKITLSSGPRCRARAAAARSSPAWLKAGSGPFHSASAEARITAGSAWPRIVPPKPSAVST